MSTCKKKIYIFRASSPLYKGKFCAILNTTGLYAQERRATMERKKLCKSVNDKKIFGVCAGVADYFNIDPTIVRVIWGVLAFAYGTGIIAYLVAAFVLPEGETRT